MTTTATPAGLGYRLMAGIYDLLILLCLCFIAAALAVALTGGALDTHTLAGKLLVQIPALVFSAAYLVLSWKRGGQTIGMKPWRLRVVTADGTPPDIAHALLRFGVMPVSLAAFGLGFAWALLDRDKRTWHDIAAGTLLVRVAKSS